MTDLERVFEKMMNMELSKEELFGQCRNVAHEPMTNEEWLEQASTEEKALFLARVYGHSRKINLPELLFRNVGTREVTDVAEYIGKWLKERHVDDDD